MFFFGVVTWKQPSFLYNLSSCIIYQTKAVRTKMNSTIPPRNNNNDIPCIHYLLKVKIKLKPNKKGANFFQYNVTNLQKM